MNGLISCLDEIVEKEYDVEDYMITSKEICIIGEEGCTICYFKETGKYYVKRGEDWELGYLFKLYNLLKKCVEG